METVCHKKIMVKKNRGSILYERKGALRKSYIELLESPPGNNSGNWENGIERTLKYERVVEIDRKGSKRDLHTKL